MNDIININNVNAYLGKDGIAYLKLEDVARGLGLVDRSKGTEKIRWSRIDGYLNEIDGSATYGAKDFIPENIFYKLCMKANNEVARKFQDLVCDEILPSIRKNGIYATTETIEQMLGNPDFGIKLLTTLKEEKEKNKELETKITELEPKATYYDLILQSSDLVKVTEIAKDYGMAAIGLNNLLHELGIQYKQGEQWFLYSKYDDHCYTQSKTRNYIRSDGTQGSRGHTYWTQKGRQFLYEVLKSKGYLPNIEKLKKEKSNEN